MSQILFAGLPIFGAQTRQQGPNQAYRSLQETLPGVNGVRVYRMGAGVRTWRVSGRLSYTTKAALGAAINAALFYQNGLMYSFTDTYGTVYTNCLLSDVAPEGEPQACIFANGLSGYTQRISATVTWTTPS
jgi:hypothetical protein